MQSDCDELRSHLERINSEIRITRSHNVGLARKLGPSSARSCVSTWTIDQLGGKGKNPVRGRGCHPNLWDSTCNDDRSLLTTPSNELIGLTPFHTSNHPLAGLVDDLRTAHSTTVAEMEAEADELARQLAAIQAENQRLAQ